MFDYSYAVWAQNKMEVHRSTMPGLEFTPDGLICLLAIKAREGRELVNSINLADGTLILVFRRPVPVQ